MIGNSTTQQPHQTTHADDGLISEEFLSCDDVQPVLSFVIPVMNEEATLEELLSGIQRNAAEFGHYEVIFIDDGSTDRSWEVVKGLAKLFPNYVRGLRFRSNRGKAAALQVGFEAARGKYIFTMDADLQDEPDEIPIFLARMEVGFDVVSGWKEVRHDPWHKVLPGRVFNRMMSYFSRVQHHDRTCGFNCYRSEVAKSIRLFGELHRMVPALSGMQGFKVTEIVVRHPPRRLEKSNLGIKRFIRGLSDVSTMGFLRDYRERPGHFANSAAANFAFFGLMIAIMGMFRGIGSPTSILFMLAGLGFIGAAGLCVVTGLFTELMIRQRFDTPTFVVFDTKVSVKPRPSRESRTLSPAPSHRFESSQELHDDAFASAGR